MRPVDVVVVGGGPAGAACAIMCARQGQKTVLLEKGRPGRHKVCGGIMPMVGARILKDDLGLNVPEEVMCSPRTLGLFYVPPSGRKMGGAMRDYRLLNVNRDRFDEWLCETAENSGVSVLYGTEFIEFRTEGSLKVRASREGRLMELESRFLIGADGVFSSVRKQLHPDTRPKAMTIVQEYWRAKGQFDKHFYAFLKGDITPAYGYLIPKDDRLLIGLGVPWDSASRISAGLHQFKQWLSEEFAFQPTQLERREAGVIPYNSLFGGDGNVILIGDAAGFCNPFSGEGIRIGIESGIMASEVLMQAVNSVEMLSPLYSHQTEGLRKFIRQTYQFAIALADEEREAFVSEELRRRSFIQSDLDQIASIRG